MYVEGFLSVGFEYMCRTGKQGRDRPETQQGICTGREDRGGHGPDAGCMTKARGGQGTESKTRPGGDE